MMEIKRKKAGFWRVGISLILAALVISGAFAVVRVHRSNADPINSTDFVITVNTGSSTTFTIPTANGSDYKYNVDCNNDGVIDLTSQTGNATCSYATPGTYTIRINGTFPRIYFYASQDGSKLTQVDQWGSNAWTSMAYAFYGCKNLDVIATDAPNLTNVTDLSGMFAGASAFNQPIGNWNTGSVTSMGSMFSGASAFNQPIGDWNTGSVTDMSYMFAGASAFNQDLSRWSFGSVYWLSTFLFNAKSFSTENYDKLLIALDKQTLRANVTFGDNSPATYCYAADARANLISADSWQITDGGQKCTSVHYDGNGNTSGTTPADATITPAGNNLIQGTVIASDNTGSLARAHYTFTGWNTAADGSGTSYIAGDKATVTGYTPTLYAQWKDDSPTSPTSGNNNSNNSVSAPNTGYGPFDHSTGAYVVVGGIIASCVAMVSLFFMIKKKISK